jgi:hypothetical protein
VIDVVWQLWKPKFSLAARAVSGWLRDWASVRRFVGARNPAERFTRLVGASDGYAMGVVLLLGGVTMVFLPLIAVCR